MTTTPTKTISRFIDTPSAATLTGWSLRQFRRRAEKAHMTPVQIGRRERWIRAEVERMEKKTA